MTQSPRRSTRRPPKAGQTKNESPFVLVHGANHGGWCWARLAPLLRAAGHDVFTPTLTGFGERAHLLGPEVGPRSAVDDIVAVLENEELADTVLVGHSFGSLVILGVADRVPDRIARLVMIDGVVVEPGQCGFDGLPPEAGTARRAAAQRHDGGLSYPPPPAAGFGLTDLDDLAWVERRLTPHPLRTYAEPFELHGLLGSGLTVTYISCTDPPFTPVAVGHPIVRREGWSWIELATGHDAMVSAPDLLAAELLG